MLIVNLMEEIQESVLELKKDLRCDIFFEVNLWGQFSCEIFCCYQEILLKNFDWEAFWIEEFGQKG